VHQTKVHFSSVQVNDYFFIYNVSEELEKQRARYYHLLNETRGKNPKWHNWLNCFLDASQRMAGKLNVLLDQSEQIAVAGVKGIQNAKYI